MNGWHAWVGLGSNLGDREAYLRMAMRYLETDDLTVIDACSPVYENDAHLLDVSSQAQPEFLNAVVRLTTLLSPISLLEFLHSIEISSGRKRGITPWDARELDLDLLLFEDLSVNTERLILPHPAISVRRFVLQPLFDLDPEMILPNPINSSVADALSTCTDSSSLVKTDIELC